MLGADGMPPVGGGRGEFMLCGKPITARDGRCVTADGTLAGAALDMASAVRNSVRLLDLPLSAALRLASAAPATFLAVDERLVPLPPRKPPHLAALDPAQLHALP